MNRRDCLIGLAGASLVPSLAWSSAAAAAFPDDSYARAIVIDGQTGIYDPYSPEPYGSEHHAHFTPQASAELRASGQTAASVTVNKVGNDLDVWPTTIKTIAGQDLWIASNPDLMIKVSTAADIRRAKAENKLGVIYNTQDSSLIGTDLDRIGVLKGLGVRVLQLTYNNRNLSGDGCLEPDNAGVSKLGHATIARIESERLLLDLSHSGQRTVAEAIAAATRPMTISHTGCRALNDNPRNQWDPELKACADKGGVVGIYWVAFISATGHAMGADVVRHMTHALNVCGEDHVGIGTDGILFKTVIDDKARAEQKAFVEQRIADGVAAPGEAPDVFNIVWDWDGPQRYHRLADALAAAGWKSSQIGKALGGNLLRLYAETWDS